MSRTEHTGMIAVRRASKTLWAFRKHSKHHTFTGVSYLWALFAVTSHQWRISAQGAINASLRSRRQPGKSLTAVSSLAAPGKLWFPPWRCLAKWHSDVQAAGGRVSRGWVNCRDEVRRDFSRLHFWVSTSKVRSNSPAIGLIWKQETFTELLLRKCAYRLQNIYKPFYWSGQMYFRKI